MFGQNMIDFTKNYKNGKQTEEVTLVRKSMLKLLLYLY